MYAGSYRQGSANGLPGGARGSATALRLVGSEAADPTLAAIEAELTDAWRRFREAGVRGVFGEMLAAELHASSLAEALGALFEARGLDAGAAALAAAECRRQGMRDAG
ncbi:hypothetical protein M0638_09545 [Roseomonas sp. NAR14]|uniref:Uncharacterized protein n=1 Tax=Roseomonas acroporae TaxID=2937791 RepID=A0A9X1Y965_9PROT|nr:hypothetical protein [Roseomonas acroporae]MCK8784625.1 hypothetical protein [Roseomonas acroporae]